MQNLKDLDIIMDENFKKVQEESVSSLVQDIHIMAVMQKYRLNKEDVKRNWADFLSYREDLEECQNCQSLKECNKVSRGMQYEMSFENGRSNLLLKPCAYGEAKFEDQAILNSILLKNVDERILLTKSQDLSMLRNTEGNVRETVAMLDTYIESPSEKGFYIFGESTIGKSTLMGWLVRALVSKKQAQCGFIHFPTFLIDLKGKFGEDGIHESMELMKNLEYLVIDDIGGENVTVWSRDEILSAILAYRGQSGKATFFTSRYNLDELSQLYILKNGDTLRVNRLIERMKAVSNIWELKGKALR